jgi:hypothetical protein
MSYLIKTNIRFPLPDANPFQLAMLSYMGQNLSTVGLLPSYLMTVSGVCQTGGRLRTVREGAK